MELTTGTSDFKRKIFLSVREIGPMPEVRDLFATVA
jgi:hypothetical protein